MKTRLFLLSLIIVLLFASCTERQQVKQVDQHDLMSVISACKGHAVVVAKGYNRGNFEAHKHHLIIRDDSLNCYVYIGAKWDVKVGDTLK